ncbi:type IV toxin-antitoxin system AbiEi family antitoxin domain-containing protein [Gordonia neofelifaecis]|nr:type IV toxin-antitoxin system AbiEi family antitoxin domain-containing protein [Gordonia neofelifaecis]
MDDLRLTALLAQQDGVVSRMQARECACSAADIRRRLRRHEWTVVFPGIYVNHTGPLTWSQRAWAAVLDAAPAALCHTSALPDPGPEIHIAVASDRKVTARPGVRVHRRPRLADDVAWHLRPPRLRVDEAVLDVADTVRGETDAIAVITDAVGSRITTAGRLLDAMARRPRMHRRTFLAGVLADVRDGSLSVLEHRYLTGVERPHGLPTPQRQAPTTVGRSGFRDVDYPEYGLVVEIDGRRFHDTPATRDRDLERDLDAAVAAKRVTLRLGDGQVIGRPCETARKIGRALADRGWDGHVTSCPRCPRSS